MTAPQMQQPATCHHCGTSDVNLDWHERFKMLTCDICFRRHERLIAKSHAKAMYLLSDSDLHQLGYVEKANPRHQKFANMKQYVLSQVQAIAVDKHGSLQAIEEEKQRRMDGKLEQRLQKRQAAEQEEERQRRRREHLQATLARYSQAPASNPQEGATGASNAEQPSKLAAHMADVEWEEF